MNSIKRSLAVLLLAAAGLIFINGCGMGKPSLKIKVFIDGSDVMKVTGNKLWFEHESWQLPGNPIYVNGKPWVPDWKDKVSSAYEGISPVFLPSDPSKIRVTKKLGRGRVGIKERPNADNGQTLAVRFDDNDFGGAAWYEIIVTW